MRWSISELRVAVALLVATSQWPGARGQKIEKDSLDKDEYNLNQARSVREEKAPYGSSLKYIVTDEVFFDISIANKNPGKEPEVGRIVIGCFGEITPITCLNFVSLAKGYRKGRIRGINPARIVEGTVPPTTLPQDMDVDVMHVAKASIVFGQRTFTVVAGPNHVVPCMWKFTSELLTYKDTFVHRIVKDFVVQMGDVSGQKGKGGVSIYGDRFQDENFRLSHRGGGWVSMANYGRDTNGSQFFVMLQPARWLDGKHVVFAKVLRGMDIIKKIGEMDTYLSGKPKQTVKIVDSGVIDIGRKYEIPESEIYSSSDMTMT